MRMAQGGLGTHRMHLRTLHLDSMFASFPWEWELACSQTPNQRAACALPTPSFTLTIIDREPSVTIRGTEAG